MTLSRVPRQANVTLRVDADTLMWARTRVHARQDERECADSQVPGRICSGSCGMAWEPATALDAWW